MAKNLLTTGAKKVFSLGKTTAKNVLSAGKDLAVSTGKELINQGKEAVAKKSSDVVNKVLSGLQKSAPTSVVDTIKNLTTNPQIKKILQEKAKQIDARHILSSIIAGSGVKRLK